MDDLIESELIITCANCGRLLEFVHLDKSIIVNPCEDCMGSEYDEGYAEALASDK